jgi:hypothetical protein
MTRRCHIRWLAFVVFLVVLRASPVNGEPLAEGAVVRAPEMAQNAFARLKERYPERFKAIAEAAAARGWKPTSGFEGWRIPGRPGTARKKPVSWFSGGQDYAWGWEGEAAVWYWEDGNPWTIEYQLYVRGYTGEDVWVEGQFVPTSADDGYHAWFEFLGGSRYSRDREHRAALLRVQLSDQKRQCLRNCLSGKMGRVLRGATRAAGTSLIACAPGALAPGAGAPFYMGCVGAGSLGGLLWGLVDEFIFQDECAIQCGVTGGGGGWENALCRVG